MLGSLLVNNWGTDEQLQLSTKTKMIHPEWTEIIFLMSRTLALEDKMVLGS